MDICQQPILLILLDIFILTLYKLVLEYFRHLSSGLRGCAHYHIRWSNCTLDWEPFPTLEEAKAQAEQLVRLGETYTVEQFDADCSRCSSLPHIVKVRPTSRDQRSLADGSHVRMT